MSFFRRHSRYSGASSRSASSLSPQEDGEGPEGWRPRGGLVPAGGAYVPWALLLKRVWRVDILRCVVCGSRRVLIEVTEPGAVQQILCHLALDSEGPARLPARGPPDEEVA